MNHFIAGFAELTARLSETTTQIIRRLVFDPLSSLLYRYIGVILEV
jgi:hypothetical protein